MAYPSVSHCKSLETQFGCLQKYLLPLHSWQSYFVLEVFHEISAEKEHQAFVFMLYQASSMAKHQPFTMVENHTSTKVENHTSTVVESHTSTVVVHEASAVIKYQPLAIGATFKTEAAEFAITLNIHPTIFPVLVSIATVNTDTSASFAFIFTSLN